VLSVDLRESELTKSRSTTLNPLEAPGSAAKVSSSEEPEVA
jgi:hypothetical protein